MLVEAVAPGATKAGAVSHQADSTPTLDALPESWTVARLGDLASLRRESADPAREDGLSYVGLEHMDSGDASLHRWGDCGEVRSLKSRFYPGDVLYGKLRPYLDKAVLSHIGGMCSTDILVMTPGPRLLSEYLANVLHTARFVRHAIATTAGVNHPRTSWSAMQGFSVALPPISEQRAIARVLRAIQRAEEATEAVIAATHVLRRSLMRHLFRYEPVPVRETARAALNDTEIGQEPNHWRFVELGDVLARTQYGLSVRGSQAGAHAMLRMNNLRDGVISTNDLQYVILDAETYERFRLSENDALFNRTNSYELVGKTSLVGAAAGSVFASYLVRLVTKQEELDPRFLTYFLNAPASQRRLKSLATRGVSQSNISASKLRGFRIPLPPLAEQQAIARTLAAVDRKLAAEEQRKGALEALFTSLLEQLMTGKLRVSVDGAESGADAAG